MNQPAPDASSLKRIAFEAVEIQFEEFQYGIQVFSALPMLVEEGPLPHLVMMRSFTDPAASLHLDCDYPLYGGVYDAVARAQVSPSGLTLDLRRNMEVQLRVLGGFDIGWHLSAERYDQIVQGLRSLFRDTDLLTVMEG